MKLSIKLSTLNKIKIIKKDIAKLLSVGIISVQNIINKEERIKIIVNDKSSNLKALRIIPFENLNE